MKTEDEARQCWCPFVKLFDDETARYDAKDVGGGIVASRCIASDCMAWRWAGYVTSGKLYPNAVKAVNNECVGWCGLAGHPDQ